MTLSARKSHFPGVLLLLRWWRHRRESQWINGHHTNLSSPHLLCLWEVSCQWGGGGGDTYRDVDSCKSKNNRRKQRNEEKVARLREKKVTQCIICISLCFYIYIFFIWTLFQHTNKKKYKTIVGKMLIKGNQVYLFAVVKFSSKKYHIKAHLKVKGGGGGSEQSNLAKLQCRWMGLHRIFIIHLINT